MAKRGFKAEVGGELEWDGHSQQIKAKELLLKKEQVFPFRIKHFLNKKGNFIKIITLINFI